MARKTWLITGCSSGLGEEFVHEVLKRGDVAIATTRGSPSRLSALQEAGAKVYSLDITATLDEIKKVVGEMIDEVGDIDVLVNNAGYMEVGLVEELSHESWSTQFDTNVFGTSKVTQAILPHFRARKAGVVVFIGSRGGWVSEPGIAAYSASKFALEALHESLRAEMKPLGIKSIIFEPGLFRTRVMHPDNIKWSSSSGTIQDLNEVRESVKHFAESMNGVQGGDPKKGVKVMVDVVKGEGVAEGKDMEMLERLPLGKGAVMAIRKKCEGMLRLLDEWEGIVGDMGFDEKS